MRLSRWMLVFAVPLVGCEELTGLTSDPDAPINLTYQLVPSGDPNAPLGVLLSWDMPRSGIANSFNVYGRSTMGGGWHLRATTTSTTFHDIGTPEVQYYVTTRDIDANEIAESAIVTIDLNASRLPAPLGLTSISLNGAIQLAWQGNAVQAGQGRFDYYRVYSTAYDGSRGVCTANWSVEGSTVSDAFYAGNLTNGASRCFAVSAVTRDGHESMWSDSRLDTPRFDARNAFVYSTTARRDSSGFLFFDDASRRVGVVAASSRTDLDFTLERQSDGSLWFAPARSGVTMLLYSVNPVADLTSIDRAPSTGFNNARIEAVPGYAYVFRVQKSDGVHFGAIRVAFKANEYVVFDWSYQSSPGNAELNRMP
ncbi:MAG TPA: hypothetical protein VIP11_24420 [Gemmatimonadaceae bacterium]